MPDFTLALRHDTPALMHCFRVPAKHRPTDQRTAARAGSIASTFLFVDSCEFLGPPEDSHERIRAGLRGSPTVRPGGTTALPGFERRWRRLRP
jgi:hypothetical protein